MADISAGTAAVLGIVTCGLSTGTLIFTAWQNVWQQGLSERKQELDFRTVQLAMLERRLTVLDTLSKALERAQFHAEPRADAQDVLYSCLLAGQTLFDEPIAGRLQDAWNKQVEYRNTRVARAMYAMDPTEAEKTKEIDVRLDQQREGLFECLKALHADMIIAARVPGRLKDL